MAKTKVVEKDMKECKHNNHSMSGGGLYGMGFIGAVVYYIQHAQTFSEGVIVFTTATLGISLSPW